MLDDRDAPSIARICSRLDGLPLAIELAASRMRHESAGALLERLQHRLPVLTGGARDLPQRQQTLRSTIAWSYDLLPAAQQSLFRRLSVFAGGFTLEAATALAELTATLDPNPEVRGASRDTRRTGSVMSDLASLLDQSLIVLSPADPASNRYVMLETIREFGQECLVESGELAETRRRHAQWFAQQVAQLEHELWDGYRGSIGRSLPGEQDNLRLALHWALSQGDVLTAFALAGGIDYQWWQQGAYGEARSVLDRLLDLLVTAGAEAQIEILDWCADVSWWQSDYPRTQELASRGLAKCREVNDRPGIMRNLFRLGRVAMLTEPQVALPRLEEALALSRELDQTRERFWCLLGLGRSHLNDRNTGAAAARYAEAASLLSSLEAHGEVWVSVGSTQSLA